MKIISGPEPLTAHALGVKLWNAEYKGKTIGQWTDESWLESETGDISTLAHSVPGSMLAELGLSVRHSPAYLHFIHLHKLTNELPEFRPYVAVLETWGGVYWHGRPDPKPLERREADISDAAAVPKPVAPAKTSKTRKPTAPVAAAPERVATAQTGVAYLRRVK